MKLIAALSLTTAALLSAGLATPLGAQVQADKSNDKTRVYAYEKRQPETYPAAGVAAPQKRQVLTPSYSSDEIPYGAQNWWREREQLSGGSGGE